MFQTCGNFSFSGASASTNFLHLLELFSMSRSRFRNSSIPAKVLMAPQLVLEIKSTEKSWKFSWLFSKLLWNYYIHEKLPCLENYMREPNQGLIWSYQHFKTFKQGNTQIRLLSFYQNSLRFLFFENFWIIALQIISETNEFVIIVTSQMCCLGFFPF